MIKKILVILVFILTNNVFSQLTCAAKEDNLEDIDSTTKCRITPVNSRKGEGAKILTVKITTNRKRYLKKSKLSINKNSQMIIKIRQKNRSIKLASVSNLLSSKELKTAKGISELDKIPEFKKCFGNKNNLECFNNEMIKHINKNFHYPAEAVKNKIQAKIWVRFIIDKRGNIRNVKTITANPSIDTSELEEVAKYVVNKLPKFKPGTKDGKPVTVKYGIPIEFSLEN